MPHTLPKGFELAVAKADFRHKNLPRHDLALILCPKGAIGAGVFTTNLFKAAPVLVSQEHLAKGGTSSAVVINSGQANACTGDQGMADCYASLDLLCRSLHQKNMDIEVQQVLPASTGVIGARMDMQAWEKAMPELMDSLGKVDLETCAKAIMTTDAFPKMAHCRLSLSSGEVRLAGLAKGAGMICPNMATMLSVVMCDAGIDAAIWQKILAESVSKSFNRVSVDGDTSTNDSLYALASGASGIQVATEADRALLQEALEKILQDLAYMLVQDGEGATKVMHIKVTGAANHAQAEQVARVVGHSQLVKTALYGRDPNWGRIVAAAGRAGVNFDPMQLRVVMCGVELFTKGQPTPLDFDALLKEPLSQTDISLELSLGSGPGEAELLASDLSHAYVSCNADYRS